MSAAGMQPPGVDFGRPQLILRTRRFSLRVPRRAQLVVAALAAVAIGIALLSLATGSYPLGLGQVVGALTGSEGGFVYTVVVEWRLPRVILAGLFGIALGLAGAIFQSLTRNPLGSPDVIGFDTGAYTGALLVMLIWHVSGLYAVTIAAIAGGLVTAAAVYLLAFRQGVQGFRLIIVGIGVTAMLTSVNTWLLLRANPEEAISATIWGSGTLADASYSQVVVAAIAFAVLFTAAAGLARGMRALELGDDAGRQLGIRAEPTRLALVVVGVGLSGTVTALAGPIAFVALAAPQIAKRLTRSAGVTLGASAATGAVLLLASDWLAQHALGSTLPVGLVTVVLGGAYFVWLLVMEARR
ncbi:MAG: iron chelate uptake ABC transporter family permease subunit [Solirubrobacterales bacterium]